MSGDTLYAAPRKQNVVPMRVHDYLYDSAYIVSGAKDYARTAFRAAMASAQVGIQPVYKTMFSELRGYPRAQIVYHPNCRLPDHMDRSYAAYVARVSNLNNMPLPELAGKDRFKYQARPKKVLDLKSASPDFHPPTPREEVPSMTPGKPRNRATQSQYRESSAQTRPWQPDGKAADSCENRPEVLYLDKLEWGPGSPYRLGDLPADFHTTEIINKMRHARTWTEVVERADFPRWMKRTTGIIGDIETKDWIFREAEIDELQDIRLNLLHRLQSQNRQKQSSRAGRKLAKLWDAKKKEMERKVEHIRHTRDRELRKLTALHGGGGRPGQVARMRAARGHGSMITAARDPTSDLYAPIARHGYQARRRHAEITYDPSLLSLEDHKYIAEPPAWLQQCGQDLTKTCSGHHLRADPMKLCERETKWSEQFLENLHNDLKKARLGASMGSAGPLHILKPRVVHVTPRPSTPQVEAVLDADEDAHQAALLLQRLIRGRAVQTLMYEGRTRAAELTEELKTTHGLQKEDRARIAREEAKAREFNATRTETEQKISKRASGATRIQWIKAFNNHVTWVPKRTSTVCSRHFETTCFVLLANKRILKQDAIPTLQLSEEDAVSALVDELCGGAVSAALDFLEKELRRLKEERRQHAFILIALREKTMREAAEAGRRQKEEHRRREHDEMFKQVVGVTQQTVDAYLQDIISSGVSLAAAAEATRAARAQADAVSAAIQLEGSMSTAEQHESVAQLVQQYLLPEAHRVGARRRVAAAQDARLHAARDAIFGLVDSAEVVQEFCTQCGCPLDELCRCRFCPNADQKPVETESRDDPRWGKAAARPSMPQKTLEERYPPHHEIRCMLNVLVDEVVLKSRGGRHERQWLERDVQHALRSRLEATIDAKEMTEYMFDDATGYLDKPPKKMDYAHSSKRIIIGALERSVPFDDPCKCPKILPSEVRRRQEELYGRDTKCRCNEDELEQKSTKIRITDDRTPSSEMRSQLLPSELRLWEQLRRCKCDTDTLSPSAGLPEVDSATAFGTGYTGEAAYDGAPSTPASDDTNML